MVNKKAPLLGYTQSNEIQMVKQVLNQTLDLDLYKLRFSCYDLKTKELFSLSTFPNIV